MDSEIPLGFTQWRSSDDTDNDRIILNTIGEHAEVKVTNLKLFWTISIWKKVINSHAGGLCEDHSLWSIVCENDLVKKFIAELTPYTVWAGKIIPKKRVCFDSEIPNF